MKQQIENTINSIEVAEMVGKTHDNVLKDIRNIIKQIGVVKNHATYFIDSTYLTKQNKELPCFNLTKKGCELFGGRMSGAKGTHFAMNYIERFNEMEEHIKQQPQIPTTQRGLVQLALSANEETNQRVDDLNDRLTEIEQNKLITTEDKGTIDAHVRKKVYSICNDFQYEKEARSMLFQELGSNIKRLFNVPNRGRIKDIDFMKALDFIDSWQPSSVVKAQINQLELF